MSLQGLGASKGWLVDGILYLLVSSRSRIGKSSKNMGI